MAVLEFTIPDFSLRSEWFVGYNGTSNYYTKAPTDESVTKTVSFASIPSGSTINSANMTATVGSPNTGAAIRTVNGFYFAGTALAVGATAGGSKDYVFKFKANGHKNSTGSFSAVQTFSNIKITVDYTLPYTACNPPTSFSFNTNNVAPNSNVTLSWSGASGGTNNAIASYDVYRSTTASGTYDYIGNSTSTSLVVQSSASNGGNLYYKVISVGSVSGFNSGYSAASGALTTTWSAPSVSAVKINSSASEVYTYASTNVTLSWTGSNGTNNNITSYTIYRDGVSFITGVTTSSYTVASHGTLNSSYTYSVAPIAPHANGSAVNAPTLYTMAPCSAPTSIEYPNNVPPSSNNTISWSGASGGGTYNPITGYEIHRSTSQTTGFVYLSTVSTTATSGSLVVTSHSGNGSTYYYKVRTLGSRVHSDFSAIIPWITTVWSSPSTPGGVSLSATSVGPSTNVTLSWNASNSGTNNNVSGYKIERSTSSTSGFTTLVTSQTDRTLTVTSHATNGTTYYYRVTALAPLADSGVSSVVGLTTSWSKPTVSEVKINGSSSAVYSLVGTNCTLSWSASSGTNNTISSYTIYRNGTAIVSGHTSTSLTVASHATSGYSYYYEVVAVAPVENSAPVTSPTLYSMVACTAPTSVSVPSDVKPSTGYTLSWSGAVGGGTYNAIYGYDIYRATSISGSYTKLGSTVVTTATSGSVAVISHASNGSSYYYKVLTVGVRASSGQSSAIATQTTTWSSPSVPGSVSVSPTSLPPSKNATLSWGASSNGTNNDVTGYCIQRSTSSTDSFYNIVDSQTARTLTVASHATNGSSYYYRVIALAPLQNSGASSVVSLKSEVSAPTVSNVKVNGSSSAIYVESGSTVTITWSASHGVNNNITSYTVYQDSTAIKTGLTSGAHYVTAPTNTSATYSVVAIAPQGNSTSVAGPAVYGYNAVGVVTGLAVSNSSPDAGTNFTLSWNAPSAVNYNSVSGYNVYYSTNNSTYSLLKEGATSPYTVTSHSSMGSTYYYKIITIGSRKNSEYSAVVSATSKTYTNVGVPTSVAWNTSATNLAPGTSRVLSWTAPSAGTNNPITKYEVHVSTDGSTYSLHASPTGTSITISSPSTNTTHYYKVRAIGTKAGFDGDFSSVVYISTQFTAPSVSAVKINNSTSTGYALKNTDCTLSWSSSNGTNNAITKYVVLRNGAAFTETTSASITVKSHATESSHYYYTITPIGTYSNGSAVNSPYLYSYSNVVAPSSVSVDTDNVAPNSSVTLRWSSATGGGTYNAITQYKIWRSTTSSSSGFTHLSTVTTTETSGTAVVTAPSTNGTYYYKIETGGARAWSGMSTAVATLTTTFTNPSVSSVKVDNSSSAVYVLSSTVALSWSGASGTNNSVVSYDIHRGSTFIKNVTTSSTTVDSPSAGSSYTYTVTPVGQYSGGVAVSSPAVTRVSQPSASTISGPSLPDANTSITLSWTSSTNGTSNNVTGYLLQYSTAPTGTYTTIAEVDNNVLSRSVNSHTTMGSSYYYRVIAVGQYFNSAPSNVLQVTSKVYSSPTTPTNLSASVEVASNPNEPVTLSWNAAGAGTNNPVSRYDVYRSTSPSTGFTPLGNTTNTYYSVLSHETRGSTYYYYVIAIATKEGFLTSPQSNTVSVNTSLYSVPSAPSNFKINDDNVTVYSDPVSNTLTWSISSPGDNNPVLRYEVQEAVYSDTTVVSNWRNATNLSGVESYTTTSASLAVYPPSVMGQHKLFRVRALGTQIGFNSAYSICNIKLYAKTYTKAGNVVISSLPNIAETSFTLSWSRASDGINNPIIQYEIQSRESSNGTSWGAWGSPVEVGVNLSHTFFPPTTRGNYIMFRVRAKGSAGSTWYGDYSESTAVKKNLVPLPGSFIFPLPEGKVYSHLHVGFNAPAEPENQTQTIEYSIKQGDSIKLSGGSASFSGAVSSGIIHIDISPLPVGDYVLTFTPKDSLNGTGDSIHTNFTKTSQTIRTIVAGSVIADHVADINALLLRINTLNETYGLPAVALSSPVGYFSTWYSNMVQIRTAVTTLYNKLGVTPPTWITQSLSYPNAAIFNQIKVALENI